MPRNDFYPVLSLRVGDTGRVLLTYKIDADGRPESVSVVLSDSPRLEGAAIRLLESIVIENGVALNSQNAARVWTVAILFELDSCGGLTNPDPQAMVLRICGKRSVIVTETGQRPGWNPDQPPDDAAVKEAIRKADAGDLDQRRWLCAQFVYWNRLIDQNPAKWCELGAQGGDPYSQAMLADLYYGGRGLATDYERAFQLYRDAAARGLDFAQMMLGAMYVLGRGVTVDRDTGLLWLKRSLEPHDPGNLDNIR